MYKTEISARWDGSNNTPKGPTVMKKHIFLLLFPHCFLFFMHLRQEKIIVQHREKSNFTNFACPYLWQKGYRNLSFFRKNTLNKFDALRRCVNFNLPQGSEDPSVPYAL